METKIGQQNRRARRTTNTVRRLIPSIHLSVQPIGYTPDYHHGARQATGITRQTATGTWSNATSAQ